VLASCRQKTVCIAVSFVSTFPPNRSKLEFAKAFLMEFFLENPCTELKELELALSQYAERRVNVIKVIPDRRRDSDSVPRRTAQARIAYMIQLHRKNCALCRSVSQAIARSKPDVSTSTA
jgi:hypothetical protein